MSICAQRQYAPTTMRIYTEHSRPMTLASSVQAGSFSARTPRDVFGDEPPVSPSTSTFGYGVKKWKIEQDPRPKMGLRVRTPDVNAARHHSGTKANARFPEHFLRDMNKQDPHHNFRTKWFESNASLARIPADTLAIATKRFQQIKEHDAWAATQDPLHRRRTTATHGVQPGRYQTNPDRVLYQGDLGFGTTSPSRLVPQAGTPHAALRLANPNFGKTYGFREPAASAPGCGGAGSSMTKAFTAPGLSSAVPGGYPKNCLASLPYYQGHTINCRMSTLRKNSLGWTDGVFHQRLFRGIE